MCLRVTIFFKNVYDSNCFKVVATLQNWDSIDELFEYYVIVASKNNVNKRCIERQFLILWYSHMRQCDYHAASLLLNKKFAHLMRVWADIIVL